MTHSASGDFFRRALAEHSAGSTTFSRSTRRAAADISLPRVLLGMRDGNLDQADAGALRAFAEAAGTHFDPQRVIIPLGLLARDLTAGTAGAGGYLVGTDTTEPADALRPWSVTARAGLTVLDGLRGSLSAPRTTTVSTTYWLSNEGAATTASQPVLGDLALTPKTVGIYFRVSRQLLLQGGGAVERYVRREMLRTVAAAIDAAVLNGSGAAGQPLGVLGTAGVQSQSGTSLGHAGLSTMKKLAAEANAADEALAFIATPAVRQILEARERSAGSGFCWEAGRVADLPAFATTSMPTATLVVGPWANVILGIWGGLTVEVNPYENFPSGIVGMRLLASIDVAVTYPQAFVKASSIT